MHIHLSPMTTNLSCSTHRRGPFIRFDTFHLSFPQLVRTFSSHGLLGLNMYIALCSGNRRNCEKWFCIIFCVAINKLNAVKGDGHEQLNLRLNIKLYYIFMVNRLINSCLYIKWTVYNIFLESCGPGTCPTLSGFTCHTTFSEIKLS